MRVGLRFSQGTLQQLHDVAADAKTTERAWLASQVAALTATYALPWRQIEATDEYRVGTGPAPASVPVFIKREEVLGPRLEPLAEPNGEFEMALGDDTVEWVERATWITTARNRAIGLAQTQPWTTPREWLERNMVDRIAQVRAEMDVRKIAEGQKADGVAGDGTA